MVTQPETEHAWALLSYRVPREPSTPRIAVWRRLKKHGALQVGDGLVALPADARTKEHLDWVAAMVAEADGEAIVWTATTSKRQAAQLRERMNAQRDREYEGLVETIHREGPTFNKRTINRLRRTWREIDRRDYFRSPQREAARQALKSITPNEPSEVSPDVEAQS